MLLFRKREEYTNDNVSLCLGDCDPLTVSWVSCLGNQGPPLTLEEIQQWCLVDVGWWGRGMNAMMQQKNRSGSRRWGGRHHHYHHISSSTAPYLLLHNSYHQRCQHCHLALFCSCTSPPLSRFYPPTNSLASSIEIDSELGSKIIWQKNDSTTCPSGIANICSHSRKPVYKRLSQGSCCSQPPLG